MKDTLIRKIMISTGTVLSLALIGILILSALLYYRAVKIQRFLEPALAVSEPRIKFNKRINDLLIQEFGTAARGITYRAGSIYVDQSLLFAILHRQDKKTGPLMASKLSRFFLSVLSDPDIRSSISLILININLPLTADPRLNMELRFELPNITAFILNNLYEAEPVLEKKYGKYFAVTAIPVDVPVKEQNSIEFRMIPSERLHIEVLESLEQYSY